MTPIEDLKNYLPCEHSGRLHLECRTPMSEAILWLAFALAFVALLCVIGPTIDWWREAIR